MIISFGWTWAAFVARVKTVTRRSWSPAYAARWKAGTEFRAYLCRPLRDPDRRARGRERARPHPPGGRMTLTRPIVEPAPNPPRHPIDADNAVGMSVSCRPRSPTIRPPNPPQPYTLHAFTPRHQLGHPHSQMATPHSPCACARPALGIQRNP